MYVCMYISRSHFPKEELFNILSGFLALPVFSLQFPTFSKPFSTTFSLQFPTFYMHFYTIITDVFQHKLIKHIFKLDAPAPPTFSLQFPTFSMHFYTTIPDVFHYNSPLVESQIPRLPACRVPDPKTPRLSSPKSQDSPPVESQSPRSTPACRVPAPKTPRLSSPKS